jgi:5-methylcytosine-specific restriction enzyme subunit McrC
MLDYAYRIKEIAFLQGLADCDSLHDFFDRLVKILLSRVTDRIRRGLHRDYLNISDRLTAVRGRIDVARQLRRPGVVDVDCCFDELTADLKENQIIAWTLWRSTRTGLCSDAVLQSVSKILRIILTVVSLTPATSADCVGQKYHRLNEDYRPIHALCRLLLESVGPSHEFGEYQMLLFIVNMGRLFELFVAEWMSSNLPSDYSCEHQQRVQIGDSADIVFRLDIVVSNVDNLRPAFIIDTKYKVPDTPSTADIAQAVTYATLKNCGDAILLYPRKLKRPVDTLIGAIRVRSLTFPIDGDLDDGGRSFLAELLSVNASAND